MLLLMLLLMLFLMLLLLLLVSIRGRPIVDVNRMLKINKTLNWRICIVGLSVLQGKSIIFFLTKMPFLGADSNWG